MSAPDYEAHARDCEAMAQFAADGGRQLKERAAALRRAARIEAAARAAADMPGRWRQVDEIAALREALEADTE